MWRVIAAAQPAPAAMHEAEQMGCSVLPDASAESRAHLGAVAPVDTAPHARAAFFGLNFMDISIITNRVAVAHESQRELISAEPYGVEFQHARADSGVSGGIFGMRWRLEEGCPRRIPFGLRVAIAVAGSDSSNRAPEHVRVLRIPTSDQRVTHRGNTNGLETSRGQQVH